MIETVNQAGLLMLMLAQLLFATFLCLLACLLISKVAMAIWQTYLRSAN